MSANNCNAVNGFEYIEGKNISKIGGVTQAGILDITSKQCNILAIQYDHYRDLVCGYNGRGEMTSGLT